MRTASTRVVLQQRAGRVREAEDVLFAGAGEIDRVGRRRVRRQAAAQCPLGSLREQRQLDPARAEEIARDRAVAAAVTDDRDARAARPVRREQRLRDVDERARRVHEMDPSCAAGRFDGVATARQRSCVRAGGAAPRRGAADGQEDDRLPGGPRRLDEGPPVEEVLAVDRDHPSPVVLGERLDELGGAEIRLIPDRHRTREAEPHILEQQRHLEHDVAALRHEADRPGRQRSRCEL